MLTRSLQTTGTLAQLATNTNYGGKKPKKGKKR